MRCPCAVSLFLLCFFKLYRPSSQFTHTSPYSNQPVQLGQKLIITCGYEQVLGTANRRQWSPVNETGIMKLTGDLKPTGHYTSDPSFGFTVHFLSLWNLKFSNVGAWRDKRSSVPRYGSLQVCVMMRCEDYGVYQCHMRLNNPKPPPETIFYHKDFYVDYVDNTPKLKIIPENAKYVEGEILNITCEQTTREDIVGLGILMKPLNSTKYYHFRPKDWFEETHRVSPADCGGYFRHYLSETYLMNERIWNSEIVCKVKRRGVSAEKGSPRIDNSVYSSPLVPSSCSSLSEGCITTIVTKANPATYDLLLPVIILIIVSFGVLVGAVFAMKHKHNYESNQ